MDADGAYGLAMGKLPAFTEKWLPSMAMMSVCPNMVCTDAREKNSM